MYLQSHPMKAEIVKVRFDLISYNLVMQTIARWKKNGERRYITITNPHSVMVCHRDQGMKKATEDAALTLPDGVGIILAAKLLGYPHNGRNAGPTLMLKLCDWGRKERYRHFFYGSSKNVVEKLAKRLLKLYPGLQVAGVYSPPFRALSPEEDRAIVAKINSAGVDILWVGLGAPKQEKWMADHVGRIKATAMIGMGAAFDFHSGTVRWAPAWIRELGLEWAYRLAQDPGRMLARNLDSPRFLLALLEQFRSKLSGRRSESGSVDSNEHRTVTHSAQE